MVDMPCCTTVKRRPSPAATAGCPASVGLLRSATPSNLLSKGEAMAQSW